MDKMPVSTLASILDPILTDPKNCPAAQLEIRRRGHTVFSGVYGYLEPERHSRPTRPDTRFDLASVTKLFTATLFMHLADRGQVELDQSVSTLLPDFAGRRPLQPYEDPLVPGNLVTVEASSRTVDAAQVTFRHLLSHTSGLPAWRPLYRQADALAARQVALTTFFSYPTGTHSIYSDIGLILLGMALETLTGEALDDALRTHVTSPLGLEQTSFVPITGNPEDEQAAQTAAICAPTEFCPWRRRRVVGQVHDENAYRLGGVAGHAGLFSTAQDVATLGQMMLDGGAPLLHTATVEDMCRLHAQEGDARRSLGFALWSPDPEASGHAFSRQAYGHTGFTGTSLWVDPARSLVVAFLTNEVYNGRQSRAIVGLRTGVHQAIVAAADAGAI